MDNMIQTTLELVRARLDEALTNVLPPKTTPSDPWVELTHFFKPDGSYNTDAEDSLVMFLANIQHETTISTYNSATRSADGTFEITPPPLYIDLFVMFAASFNRYADGLDVISRAISFFQQHPCFNHATLPGLHPEIDQLTFEMVNMDITDLNYLIGLAGIKYLPLTLYKIRMLPFTGDMTAQVPEVTSFRDQAGLRRTGDEDEVGE